MNLSISARTDIGQKRITNEDNFSVNDYFMLPPAKRKYAITTELPEAVCSVCDGMGGESYGEYASLAGVKVFAESYAALLDCSGSERAKTADRCIQSANADICAEMQRKKVRIGSTAVLACIQENRADIFNIGDSRAYLLRNGTLRQLSKDHTVVQQKIDFGAMTQEQAAKSPERNQLTQNLGIFESEMLIEAHHARAAIEAGDILLLCSDGLTDMVSNDTIAGICKESPKPALISSVLIDKALENGGRDNVTVVVICVGE